MQDEYLCHHCGKDITVEDGGICDDCINDIQTKTMEVERCFREDISFVR